MTDAAPPPPPTIDSLRRMGLKRVDVTCTRQDCRRQASLTLDGLGLPGDTPFPQIRHRRRFTCSACGGHDVAISIDWRDYRPAGKG